MRQAAPASHPVERPQERWPGLLANEADLERLRAAGHGDLAARVKAPPRTPSQTPVRGSYDARLMRLHGSPSVPLPARPAPVGAGVLAAPVTTPRRTIAHWLLLAAGGVAGVLLVFPVAPLASDACPPAGEGQISCLLTRSWLPAATKVALIVLAAHLVARLVLDWIPQAIERRRAMRASRAALPAAPAPRQQADAQRDPLLAAATWGRLEPRA